MRHAKSSWKNLTLADHDRPLNKRGTRAAPAMADHLRKQNLFPDYVLGSTAVRVKRTAELLLRKSDVPSEFIPELYHAEPDVIFAALKNLPDSVKLPMIIGHNPGLEDFLEQWVGAVRMPTAAICVLKIETGKWAEVGPSTRAELKELWHPKKLGIS